MITTMPSVTILNQMSSLTDRMAMWTEFGDQITKHCKKLYKHNAVSQTKIPLFMTRIAVMLHILEKMAIDGYIRTLRMCYSFYIWDQMTLVDKQFRDTYLFIRIDILFITKAICLFH